MEGGSAPDDGRIYVERVENAIRREKDLKEQELARKVRQADCEAVLAKIDVDLAALQASIPNDRQSSMESAKDLKYLKQRQE